ncbi:MAG: exodeoxyribonuclease V subunit alpha [Nitriliruptoraceae bacterium]
MTGEAAALPEGPASVPELEVFVAAGVLMAADVRLAQRLGRIGGDDGPDVLLAVALALRGPRHGHVCVELDDIAGHLAIEPTSAIGAVVDAGVGPADDTGISSLPWPSPERWQRRLAESPLVRAGGPGETPLVLEAGRLYLDRYWEYEQQLASELLRRASDLTAPDDPTILSGWLDDLFGPATTLDRQRLAAVVALHRRLTVIAGGPGTGKTYTVTRVLALLHLAAQAEDGDRPLRVALAAPTGKAAARLQESLRDGLGSLVLAPSVRAAMEQTPASTIHRLLGVRRGGSTRFRHDADAPLPHDVVIVDEASMVSLPLMAKLVAAVRPDARLLLLGDRDQLASVEAGAAFGDICGPDGSRPVLRLSAEAAATVQGPMAGQLAGAHEVAEGPGIWDAIVRLDRFHRFAGGSDLGAVAVAIQRAEDDVDEVVDLLRGEEGDVRLLDPDVDDDARARVERSAVTAYGEVARLALAGAPAREVLEALGHFRVLCARRSGRDGVGEWNRTIEAQLGSEMPALRVGQRWYVGRPVMVTENDHTVRLYNGDVGVVLADPERAGRLVVAFWTPDGQIRSLSPSRLPACETTYAMTIHKSQGSQFEHVAVVLTPEPSPVLTRELLYTALTRASEQVSVLGREPILRTTLTRPIQRASGLQQRLWGRQDRRSGPGR